MHTPGPWLYEQAEGEDRLEYNLGWVKTPPKPNYPHGEYLFTIGTPDSSDNADTVAKREADARLIADAPAMLALLAESQTSIGGDWRKRRDTIVAKHTS